MQQTVAEEKEKSGSSRLNGLSVDTKKSVA
jgi:hypothetical protein